MQRVATPDVVIDCEPLECVCDQPEWTDEREIAEHRQVFELPVPRLQVVEYRRMKRQGKCGRRGRGEFPGTVLALVQYGAKVQALVTHLSVHGCLPYRKIGQIFADIYVYELNEATAQELLKRTAAVLPLAEIKAAIEGSAVVHLAETRIKENGQLQWLHNASTAHWTYQFVHDKRGQAALTDEASVLPNCTGVAVHDCWGSYFGFAQMKHAVCNAHIVRELHGIIENNESRWGDNLKELLLEMYLKSDFGKGLSDETVPSSSATRKFWAAEKEEPPPPECIRRAS